MHWLKNFFTILAEAGQAWSQDKASLYAAAIAYYMVFSIAPLLVFMISIAGRVFGQAAVEGQVVAQVTGIIGIEAAALLQSLLENAASGSSSFTLISLAILLWAGSGVFNQLKRALDIIYGVIPKQIPGLKGILFMIRHRFLAFAMVLLMGLMLLAALAVNTVATALDHYLALYLPEFVTINAYIGRILTPIILIVLFAVIFKTLPEAVVAWRDVALGALLTTLLFLLGIFIIRIYLNYTDVGSVYGAASSLIVVLVWIYYSTQILMYGAEFVKVYAGSRGRPVLPSDTAKSLAEHYNNVLPDVVTYSEPEPELEPRPVFGEEEEALMVEPSPKPQVRRQAAAALIGLAAGLFLAFIGQFFQDE